MFDVVKTSIIMWITLCWRCCDFVYIEKTFSWDENEKRTENIENILVWHSFSSFFFLLLLSAFFPLLSRPPHTIHVYSCTNHLIVPSYAIVLCMPLYPSIIRLHSISVDNLCINVDVMYSTCTYLVGLEKLTFDLCCERLRRSGSARKFEFEFSSCLISKRKMMREQIESPRLSRGSWCVAQHISEWYQMKWSIDTAYPRGTRYEENEK